MGKKVVITCALTGVLTNPDVHRVPVTPKEMADAAQEAYNAGASVVHLHFRNQNPGKGHLPTWDPMVAAEICDAIKSRVPELILNLSTGVLGDDISDPVACLEKVVPELAAMNAGSLNYLKAKDNGGWAWKPMIFDNSVEKIEKFLDTMDRHGIIPECECFDTGILRSIKMFQRVGLLKNPFSVSLVMGVASGMPAKASWLPLLMEEIPEGIRWQTIAIGRQEIWELHRKTAQLGGHLRTGLEDTFYLPSGDKTSSNGKLIEELAKIAKECNRSVASPEEARSIYGIGKK